MAKWMAIVFGAVPVLGWLLSMLWNCWKFGTPFTGHGEWNNLPLWLATFPCMQIADVIFSDRIPLLWHHPYAGVVVYTLVCAILYALAGSALGLLVRKCVCAWTCTKNST